MPRIARRDMFAAQTRYAVALLLRDMFRKRRFAERDMPRGDPATHQIAQARFVESPLRARKRQKKNAAYCAARYVCCANTISSLFAPVAREDTGQSFWSLSHRAEGHRVPARRIAEREAPKAPLSLHIARNEDFVPHSYSASIPRNDSGEFPSVSRKMR